MDFGQGFLLFLSFYLLYLAIPLCMPKTLDLGKVEEEHPYCYPMEEPTVLYYIISIA